MPMGMHTFEHRNEGLGADMCHFELLSTVPIAKFHTPILGQVLETNLTESTV